MITQGPEVRALPEREAVALLQQWAVPLIVEEQVAQEMCELVGWLPDDLLWLHSNARLLLPG